MMTIEATHTMETNDADLVAESRDGSREAFRQIVERYQTLICSLAYSATGNVSQSEDVAQETFLTAWTDLRSLREPNKLRAWLCGIVRNRSHKSLKREGREPAHDAELLETVHDLPAQEAIPSEQTISREEEAILWRSLERIPELYREPIILFYREHQSIESVAAELDLSEDAVKQRLSRGRKLLQEEVQAFVESALSRTAPSQAFASTVLAALPAAPAAVGVGMAGKGAAAAKSGFLAAWLVPMIGILSGIVAGWLIVRSAPTAQERRAKMIAIWGMWIFALAWCVPGQLAVRALDKYYQWSDLTLFDTMVGFWWLYTVIIATLIIVMFRQILASRRQSEEEVGALQTSGTPLTWGTRIIAVAGIYLSSFLWLITLAWQAQDLISVGIFAGAMVVLGICHFFQFHGRNAGVAAMRGGIRCLTLAFGVIVLMLNWRLDVWMAAQAEISVAEIHRLYPMWLIPVLTLALMAWIGILLALTKPKRSASRNGRGGNSRGNNMKKIPMLMLLAGCFLTFICPTMGQSQTTPLAGKPAQADAAIPDQFRPLYRELEESLRQARQIYPYQKGNARPLVTANLLLASSTCHVPDLQDWKDLLATLDAFQAMNINAVHVLIMAPDLLETNATALVDFYQRLASEIHSRNMKFYVEHFVYPPASAHVPKEMQDLLSKHALKGLHDDPQGRKDFLNMMEKEISLVYRDIKPDYLSIVTEPETLLRWTHLSLSADDLANWVGEVTTRLKSTGASPNTLLGAGALTWESEDFDLKFAQQANLDYIDIHLYALKLKNEDQLARLSTLVQKIRQQRPNMRIAIGEAWLLKTTGASEPSPPVYRTAFFQNNFSFWSPLDQQFLSLLMGVAQKENISIVVPFFSQFYFTNYTFGDAESSKLPPWPLSDVTSWDKALEPIRNHQLSPTGKAMSEMLDDGGK
jgi:RNA polymerase sigma factor (sigma-70 family)